MQPLYINLNGDFIAADDKLFTAANRGFKYGDGVFESMRIANGVLLFANFHSARLQEGMRALKIDGYSQLDEWWLKQKCADLAVRNKAKNARVRLTVYRDADGLYTPSANKAGYCLELEPLGAAVYETNNRGLIIDVFTDITKPVNALANLKTCNALLYVLAGLYKTQNSLDDALILNQSGFLCESISANIFVLYGGQLYTPALSEGCIAGVMRSVIKDLAAKIGYKVTEAQINPQILYEAEEVFLTNATRGVQWIMGFGVKRYFNQLSKQLTLELNKLVSTV